jgi:asparagine synthetase B (glutamine-hydrolysing)
VNDLRKVPSLKYLNKKNTEVSDFLSDAVRPSWQNVLPENFERNTLQGLLKRNKWKPVVDGIKTIYPGMVFDEKKDVWTETSFKSPKKNVTIDSFLKKCEQYFLKFHGNKIAVQLSGGVDSSLIVGLLKYFGIKFSLVGMSSSRYEFRTEKKIQQILASAGQKVCLIDFEDFLPHSMIKHIPPHEYPDISAINFAAENAMATACNEIGADILFSGAGGDVLFRNPFSSFSKKCVVKKGIFLDYWLKDVVYSPCNVRLEAFYENDDIASCIMQLRNCQPIDKNKLWARHTFRKYLPKELTEYTYRADFWGLYLDGYKNMQSTLIAMNNEVYELTKLKYFSPNKLSELLDKDLLNSEKKTYQKLESHAAISSWICALNNSWSSQKKTK